MSEPQLRPTCGPVSQPQLCKPFLTLNVLFVLMLFSGKFAIEMYAVDIFKQTQDSVDENTATVILGKGVDIYRDRHTGWTHRHPHVLPCVVATDDWR